MRHALSPRLASDRAIQVHAQPLGFERVLVGVWSASTGHRSPRSIKEFIEHQGNYRNQFNANNENSIANQGKKFNFVHRSPPKRVVCRVLPY
jgi:hypothetical protein